MSRVQSSEAGLSYFHSKSVNGTFCKKRHCQRGVETIFHSCTVWKLRNFTHSVCGRSKSAGRGRFLATRPKVDFVSTDLKRLFSDFFRKMAKNWPNISWNWTKTHFNLLMKISLSHIFTFFFLNLMCFPVKLTGYYSKWNISMYTCVLSP